jgi:uncharacterized protein involved in exopolysaccharide biosynthesis
MSRPAAVVQAVWHHRWWLLAPTVLTAAATSVLSSYFLPIRYRSESVIQVVSRRIPAEYVGPTITGDVRERVLVITQNVLSRRRLEDIINEFGLYEAERQETSIENVVERMRADVTVNFAASDRDGEGDLGGFRVGFQSSEPHLAMTVTERLTRMIVEENLRGREVAVETAGRFIAAQIDEMRRRIIAYEKTLAELREQNGGRALSQADLLPYEVLLDSYRSLLVRGEQARMTVSAERRQIGEQFRVVDRARMPERPVGPSRMSVNAGGIVTGLVLGLVAIGVRNRSTMSSD